MKLTRSLMFVAVFAGSLAAVATIARAGTGCPDDPERCVERGASTTHRMVVIASNTRSTTTTPAVVNTPAPAHKPAPAVSIAKAVARKPAAKPARPTPSVSAPTPATPGMGMLLKMSGGTGGDVSWFPSRPVDTTGASWIL